MTVAASVAQQTRPGRTRKVAYTCPGCGETRDMSYENHQRIVRGIQRPECRGCPGPAPQIQVTEEHRQYWLVAFGVSATALTDTTSDAYVRQHGAPQGLLALAAGLNGTP